MTDPSQQQYVPSEEEQRAIEQLRDADPAVVVVQAFEVLASGAVIKLGRSDARVLIDLLGTLVEAAHQQLPEQLVAQLRQDVNRLQIAQVQAEQQAAAQAADKPGAESASGAEQQGQGAGQAGAGQAGAGQAGAGQAGGQRMTDRLWIPGQGGPAGPPAPPPPGGAAGGAPPGPPGRR